MSFSFDYISSRISWLLLAIAMVCLALEWFWKPIYVWGGVTGFYWLLILVDWAVFPLAIVSLIGGTVSGFIWLLRSFQKHPKLGVTGVLVFRLMASGIIYLVAIFQAMISLWSPVDQIVAGDRTYYLANTTLFNINYGLFESDRYGIFSRQVYRSDGYVEPIHVDMHFDTTAGKVILTSKAGKVIHSHMVPVD